MISYSILNNNTVNKHLCIIPHMHVVLECELTFAFCFL